MFSLVKAPFVKIALFQCAQVNQIILIYPVVVCLDYLFSYLPYLSCLPHLTCHCFLTFFFCLKCLSYFSDIQIIYLSFFISYFPIVSLVSLDLLFSIVTLIPYHVSPTLDFCQTFSTYSGLTPYTESKIFYSVM